MNNKDNGNASPSEHNDKDNSDKDRSIRENSRESSSVNAKHNM